MSFESFIGIHKCHDTRSGDVASDALKDSNCEILVNDVYAWYKKAVKEINIIMDKQAQKQDPILMAYCNSHARRNFTPNEQDNSKVLAGAQCMIDEYKEIYKLEIEAKGQTGEKILEIRKKIEPIFVQMKSHAEKGSYGISDKSALAKAYKYFVKNYNGLTLFISNPEVPIDNNASERQLRSHVVGRKTWYGTYSVEGASVAAIHFSVIESCKLNKINPRIYYRKIIEAIHNKKPIFTPGQFLEMSQAGEGNSS